MPQANQWDYVAVFLVVSLDGSILNSFLVERVEQVVAFAAIGHRY